MFLVLSQINPILRSITHLQVHDELVFEVRQDRLNDVAALVRRVMESAWKLKVPTPVEIKLGPSWGQLENISLGRTMKTA
jgi:DNA polymerase I-like protein with 3'-5' exonuclease and polymerase domains